MREAHHQQHKPSIELYDLTKDPFESENLGNRHEYRDKIKEIRAWAERQIGLPPPAVVGQWNMAYEKMMRVAYEKAGSKKFLVDSRDYLLDIGLVSGVKGKLNALFLLSPVGNLCFKVDALLTQSNVDRRGVVIR